MKRSPAYLLTLLPLAFMLLTLPSVSQDTRFKTSKGFNVYIFGTAPAAYRNLQIEIEEGNSKLYSVNQANITIAGVEIEFIRLTFTKNKLTDIVFQTKNATGAKLLQNMRESYGEPTRANKIKKNYEWLSDKAQMLYEYNRSGTDATVSYSSKT